MKRFSKMFLLLAALTAVPAMALAQGGCPCGADCHCDNCDCDR